MHQQETNDTKNSFWELAYAFAEYTGQHLFITGKAGTGKTTFLKQLTGDARKKQVIIAPTGVAAMNAGGVTLNSFFQIPPGYYLPEKSEIPGLGIYNQKNILANINYSVKKKELIRNLETIVIDEVSMIRPDQIDLINEILRSCRNSSLAFGGVQLILIGDLFQLPPVISTESQAHYGRYYPSAFFFNATVFKTVKLVQIEFDKVLRQTDERFINILNEIRTNSVSVQSLHELNSRHLPNFAPTADASIITLTSHNQEAININSERLAVLTGQEYIFEAEIKGYFKEASFPTDRTLRLKLQAQVMFIRNDAGEDRKFFNGKIGIISKLSKDQIEVTFPDGNLLQVERSTWQNLEYRENSVHALAPTSVGEFHQFPIRLAWAITIHKSQGLTFEKAIVDAAQSFTAGQVYVALSRVKSLEGLVLKSPITAESIMSSNDVVSFLLPEPFSSLQKQLNALKPSYLFKNLINSLSLIEVIGVLHDLSQKPETFKQKLGNEALILLDTLYKDLKKLELTIRRFANEVDGIDWHSPDYGHLYTRFNAANEYIDNELQQVYSSNQLPDVQGKVAKEYIDLVRSSLQRHVNARVKALEIIGSLMNNGNLEALILMSRAKDGLSSPEIAAPPETKRRTRSLNSSIKGTVDLLLAGKSLAEIATIRNLGINTVETHLLEALKIGGINISSVVSQDHLELIQQEISLTGMNIYDLKERLGEHCSFFEIRAVVTNNS